MNKLDMKHRLARYTALTVVVILAFIGGTLLFQKWTLSRYRHFVESSYQAELSLIEDEMRAGKEEAAELDTLDARNQVRKRIGQALSEPDFFAASWSSDGHHGLESLKQMPTGYSRSCLIGSTDSGKSHALYFGQAEDGTKLLVYVGWVQSDWKREYDIAFRRSVVDLKMKSK
jgi:hypothetical protein